MRSWAVTNESAVVIRFILLLYPTTNLGYSCLDLAFGAYKVHSYRYLNFCSVPFLLSDAVLTRPNS